MAGPWLASPGQKYGGSLNGQQSADPAGEALAAASPAVQPSLAGMASPKDPMFWFAVVAAGTVALMAYSTVQTS